MEVTHLLERKQIKAIYTIKFQIQQKLKPYTLLNYKFSKTWNENYVHIQQTSLLIHCFVFGYFKVKDRRQLVPTYTCRISGYQHLGL